MFVEGTREACGEAAACRSASTSRLYRCLPNNQFEACCKPDGGEIGWEDFVLPRYFDPHYRIRILKKNLTSSTKR